MSSCSTCSYIVAYCVLMLFEIRKKLGRKLASVATVIQCLCASHERLVHLVQAFILALTTDNAHSCYKQFRGNHLPKPTFVLVHHGFFKCVNLCMYIIICTCVCVSMCRASMYVDSCELYQLFIQTIRHA